MQSFNGSLKSTRKNGIPAFFGEKSYYIQESEGI